MSFLTCFCDLPQNEHLSRSPPSPIRATYVLPAQRPLTGELACNNVACPGVTARARAVRSTLPGRSHNHRPLRTGCFGVSVHPCGGDRGLLPAAEHLVDQAVLLGLVGREDLVTVNVLADLVHAPA